MGSIERTPNQRWRARCRDRSGRTRSTTFDRKVDAARYLELVGADLQRGEWYENRSVPLPRFVDAQAAEHLAARAGLLWRSLVPNDCVFGDQSDPVDGLNRDGPHP